MKGVFPIFAWLPNYNKKDLSGDFSAGLIVAIMLIPQGIAYAMLAGLPPVMGLYASTVPLIVYALFGTSRHLGVGPIAVISLLVFTGVSPLAAPGSAEYVSLVILLTLMVGLIQFAMGVLKLGFIVNFLSHAVISGFTSASAIIIGFSQLKHLVGIPLQSENVLMILWETMQRIAELDPITLGIGLASIFILIFLGKYFPKIPAQLVAVVLTILLTYFLGLHRMGVQIVGDVPGGFPDISLPFLSLNLRNVVALLPVALTISFIGFVEAIAIGKSIATREKYEISSNQELIGLGMANVASSFVSGYPVTGAFSRSAVNYQSGGRTQLSSIITAVIIISALLFFTGLFYYLPNTVLAAIVMVAVYKLIDIKEARYLFKVNTTDGMTWLVTFLVVLIVGVEQGILIGVAISLIFFIRRSAYPHTAELGYLESEDVFRDITHHPNAKVDPEVLIFRPDASLYFANMAFLEDELYEEVKEAPDIKWIIYDFSGVNSIDAVAIHSLEKMIEDYSKRGIQFKFVRAKRPVLEMLKKAGWEEKHGSEMIYYSIRQALMDIDEERFQYVKA